MPNKVKRHRNSGLVKRAQDWPWSSARAHLAGCDDAVVNVAPVLERVGDFQQFLGTDFEEEAAYGPLRRAETVGRPVGDRAWLQALEKRTGRPLLPGKRGPRAKPTE